MTDGPRRRLRLLGRGQTRLHRHRRLARSRQRRHQEPARIRPQRQPDGVRHGDPPDPEYIVGTNFVFSFTRRLDSAGDTTQTFESSTNLSDWTTRPPLTIPGTTAGTYGEVVVGSATGTPPNEVQAITITIPKGSATKLFGRLNVSQ